MNLTGSWIREDNKTEYIFLGNMDVMIYPKDGSVHKLRYEIKPDREFPKLILDKKEFLIIAPTEKMFHLATNKGIITFKKI